MGVCACFIRPSNIDKIQGNCAQTKWNLIPAPWKSHSAQFQTFRWRTRDLFIYHFQAPGPSVFHPTFLSFASLLCHPHQRVKRKTVDNFSMRKIRIQFNLHFHEKWVIVMRNKRCFYFDGKCDEFDWCTYQVSLHSQPPFFSYHFHITSVFLFFLSIFLSMLFFISIIWFHRTWCASTEDDRSSGDGNVLKRPTDFTHVSIFLMLFKRVFKLMKINIYYN